MVGADQSVSQISAAATARATPAATKANSVFFMAEVHCRRFDCHRVGTKASHACCFKVMQDFITILVEKVRSEPDRSEPTFAGLYRYFLKVYANDEAATRNAMELYMLGQWPTEVVADLNAFRPNPNTVIS